MSRDRSNPHAHLAATQTNNASPLVSIGLVLGMLALLWAASYPLLALGIFAGAVGTMLVLRAGLATVARRMNGRMSEFTVPGVGTVKISISPQ